jgi:hypothetical protein
MLEFYFSYPGVLKRLRGGALGAEMDRIAGYFSSLGYKRASAKIYLSRIKKIRGVRGKPSARVFDPEIAGLLRRAGAVPLQKL